MSRFYRHFLKCPYRIDYLQCLKNNTKRHEQKHFSAIGFIICCIFKTSLKKRGQML